jgi:HAD superfamily hydrolase (TIGR01509 family)
MARMPRAIVFDFDGVIVDTEPLHFAAFREVLPGFGIALARDTYFSRYLGMSDEEILRRVLSDQNRRLTPEEVRQLLHNKNTAYRRRIEPGLRLATGAEALIRRASLKWVLAICSGSKRVEIEHILRRADLLSLFPVIVATGDVATSKPDPAGYLLTIARLQQRSPELRPNDCLVIEDSAAGVAAAKQAGMRTLRICQGESCEADGAADTTVQSLAELTDIRLEALLA